MVTLLQGHVGASDVEAVVLSVVDLRWHMVLGCLRAAMPHSRRARCTRSGSAWSLGQERLQVAGLDDAYTGHASREKVV
ncbi:hypothetical protein WME99_25010 [Sorangium sp. So ce136]|uniref:hypothetical protein n=1 Tax=Sorangium sp. So ce136 TaxID=3133284 RepID=UPI003F10733E